MKRKKELPKGIVYKETLEWKVHTVNLLQEILLNPGTGIMKIPFKIYGCILAEVAERASQLNDPILNGLMCRLVMYEIADPNSKAYDRKLLKETMKKYEQAKKKLKLTT